ncbi:hypothetical protein [Alteromonas gilva]|uniref:Uncharacterized protein n=1 Tax=Alteromonas gilva TaxID=2987522 RepID=A0ABT5L5Z0_9ALTE|nr:hypothetical protein [Alteromonas gilva]MDC8832470.1 hypothetical protein [Alteromonas gilva]
MNISSQNTLPASQSKESQSSYSTVHCVYTDLKHARFSVILDSQRGLQFVYWLELKKLGIRHLNADDELCARFIVKDKRTIERGLAVVSAVCFDKPADKPGVELHEAKRFDENGLKTLLAKGSPLIVFRGCRFDRVNLEALDVATTVAFFDCDFDDDFRLIACRFPNSLWFSNSRFHKHFSLKSSQIEDSIHMESCDFSGPGGVSFRGVQANNIYLDFGVVGCDDIVWLNEITVPGVVSVGGTFNNDIELIGNQDEETSLTRCTVGAVYMGHELYDSESANTTLINARFKCKDCDTQALAVANTTIKDCVISNSTMGSISFVDATIEKDLTLSDVAAGQPENTSLMLERSSVERHLKLFDNRLSGDLCLQNSTIGGNAYLEDNQFEGGQIQLNRLSAARLVFLPIHHIYQKKRYFPLSLTPRRFIVDEPTEPHKCAEVYCALKNWFSDSGQLDAEDDAYFYMRQRQPHHALTRLIFGYIFGWGVRLRNIAISSMVLIGLFVMIFKYYRPEMDLLVALALSVQSFTGNFFGKWPDYEPSGLVAGFAVLESIFGLVFITVFIGAYIRKLLR